LAPWRLCVEPPFSVVKSMPRSRWLISFDVRRYLFRDQRIRALARENSLKAMLAAGLNADINLRAGTDEVITEFNVQRRQPF